MGSALDINNDCAGDELTDELKPGTSLLHGQYVIERFLKVGGFGLTYLARDSLDRIVVIKECFPESMCRRTARTVRAFSQAHQEEFHIVVRLFVQEARRLAKMRHPNIVGVHQVFEDNGTAYMALDYVPGDDLLDVIEAGPGRLPPEAIREMLEKLLCAIGFVHQHGLLHRDIAPDNILLSPDGEPVLIDFGAAREQASRTSRVLSALQVVKDGYSPQEFYISGGAQGPASDLYSLAATFYHLISGNPPPGAHERLAAVKAGQPDPYRPLLGRFPEQGDDLLHALDLAMSLQPSHRPQSAQDWLALIGEVRRQAAVLARAQRDAKIELELSQLVAETNEAVADARRREEQRARERAATPPAPKKKKPYFSWQLEEDWGLYDTEDSAEAVPALPAEAEPTPPERSRSQGLLSFFGRNLRMRLRT